MFNIILDLSCIGIVGSRTTSAWLSNTVLKLDILKSFSLKGVFLVLLIM